MIPDAEYSSSRRFVTTVWHIEKLAVLPRVVDVVVGMQDPAHVVDLDAVRHELVSRRHLLR